MLLNSFDWTKLEQPERKQEGKKVIRKTQTVDGIMC